MARVKQPAIITTNQWHAKPAKTPPVYVGRPARIIFHHTARPKETVENVSIQVDPLDIALMTREQRQALKRELLRQHPKLTERILGLSAVH